MNNKVVALVCILNLCSVLRKVSCCPCSRPPLSTQLADPREGQRPMQLGPSGVVSVAGTRSKSFGKPKLVFLCLFMMIIDWNDEIRGGGKKKS